ncbi:hypothetical protein ACJX0J_035694 [Zea mays]
MIHIHLFLYRKHKMSNNLDIMMSPILILVVGLRPLIILITPKIALLRKYVLIDFFIRSFREQVDDLLELSILGFGYIFDIFEDHNINLALNLMVNDYISTDFP